MSTHSPTALYADYGGLRDAGRVADRQADHLVDVGHYVADVCGRTEAFRGFLRPFAATYDSAVTATLDGVAGSGRAATRWATATRDTADGLAQADALARRLVSALTDLLPAAPQQLPAATAATAGPMLPGLPPICPVGEPPPALSGSPLPLTPPLPVAVRTELEPDLPRALTALDDDGPFGTAAGPVVTGGKGLWDLHQTGRTAEDTWAEASDVDDDLDRFADFVGSGA